VQELANRVEAFDRDLVTPAIPDRAVLLSLAEDLPAVWHAPTTEMRLKQRIVRLVLQEIVADVEETDQTIVLLIHWAGGRHSEIRVNRNRTGRHRRCTSLEAIDVIRRMAERFPDEQIAATLNRLGFANREWEYVERASRAQRTDLSRTAGV
jgi:hypothetical protein